MAFLIKFKKQAQLLSFFKKYFDVDRIRILMIGICTVQFIITSYLATRTSLTYDEGVHVIPSVIMYRYFQAILTDPTYLIPNKARTFLYSYYGGTYHVPYFVLFYYPPLYSLLTFFVFLLFGISTYSARFVSVFSLSFMGLVCYEMTKLLTKNRRVSIIASILTISFFEFVAYGSQALLEVPLTLLSLLTLYFFIYAHLKEKKKIFWYSLSGIFFGLTLLMKQLGVLVIPILVIYILLSSKNENSVGGSIRGFITFKNQNLKSTFTFFGFSSIIAGPWYVFLLLKQTEFLAAIWKQNENIVIGPPWTAVKAWYYWGFILFYGVGVISGLLIFFGILYCLYCKRKSDLFILSWIGSVLIVFTIASPKALPYILLGIPAFFIALAIALDRLSIFLSDKVLTRRLRGNKARIMIITCVYVGIFVFQAIKSVEILSNPGNFDLTYVPIDESTKFVINNTPRNDAKYRVLQIGWSSHFSPYAFICYMMMNDNAGRIEYWLLHSWETTIETVEDFVVKERIYYVVIYIETEGWGDLKKPIDLDSLAEKNTEYSIASHILKSPSSYILEKSYEEDKFSIFICHPLIVH